MTALGILPPILMMFGCLAYVFWSQARLERFAERTRLDYLRERQEVLYENLRDLNFEYRAGKYQLDDYNAQREGIEAEAVRVVTEMRVLENARSRGLAVE